MRALALLLVVSAGCARPLTGGWEGDVDCDEVGDGTAAALFVQDAADELDGDVYVQFPFFGSRTTFKTEVDDFDPQDDGTFEMDLHYDPEDDDDGRPDFRLRVGYGETDSVLEGEADVLDDDGARTDECDVELVRVGEQP